VRILAFDTATRATTVALLDAEAGIAVQARDDPPRGARPRHTSRLMSLIVEAMQRGDTGWDEVDRLAVGVGPGTFTGLRIGVATARALARARTIPLVGISTLESLALGAADGNGDGGQGWTAETVLAVLDARRGEAFAAAWPGARTANGAWPALLAPRAWSPQALADASAALGRTRLGIGDGAVEFRQVLERSGTSVPEDDSQLHLVSAINHCRLAGASKPSAGDEVRPEYLREPDAELARRAAAKR
jgi:tRNA threonylcarbamoyladenosine biosynthesis protein TsaB